MMGVSSCFSIRKLLLRLVLAGGLAGLALLGVAIWKWGSVAAWQTFRSSCMAPLLRDSHHFPCLSVRLSPAQLLLKDRHGPLHLVLIPLRRLVGIEDPALLTDDVPNYWAASWTARTVLDEMAGQPLAPQHVLLAINSPPGRTRDHLHIHIDCIHPDVRQALNQAAPRLGPHWISLPVRAGMDPALVRRIHSVDLSEQDPFRLLAQSLQSGYHMADFGLAATPLPDGGFALLAAPVDLPRKNRGTAELFQDHGCHILPVRSGS